jgi:hypothetical protein
MALVIGALLVLVSLGLLGAGGTALWADRTQRDAAGYVTTGVHEFSAPRSALVTERVELDSPAASQDPLQERRTSGSPLRPARGPRP